MTLRLSWLGTPRIDSHASALHLPTRKATALLAILSCSGQPHSRESLAAIFWPEFDQARAHANLRRALASINQILGSNILESDRETVGINPNAPLWTDVGEFCFLLTSVQAHSHTDTICPDCVVKLEKAIDLYQGDFLTGFNLKACPEFDDWQSLKREGLRSNLASMLERLSGAYLASGEWEKAILKSRQWVSLDHLNELAQRRLIQAYARSGQRSAAIRQYEECEYWLQADLGQSPEKETVALYQQIRIGDIGGKAKLSLASSNPPQAGFAPQPLIKTKFFIPQRHPGLVSRQHLLSKLDQGAQRALTLISAPAGYWKTTLLSEWIDTLQKAGSSPSWAVCWISLDPGDNDPIRFLTYLTTALEIIRPGVSAETQSVIRSSESFHPATPLSGLINDLQGISQSVLLVLDDYQFIVNPIIHDGIKFLIEHMPINVHLVIATRSDPPLPLALLRGRNQLTEVRANDIRFTPNETIELLNKVFNLGLTPKQIEILDHRTEGWVAGLQMAAISMQDRLDIAQFIQAFSGSHRFIMDYLAEEALIRQTVETQEFLFKTSILERLSQPLCDFVITGDPNTPEADSSSLKDRSGFQIGGPNRLIQLERSNLFIVPLDDERVWYRYHHLFADLLYTRLQHASPDLVPILHRRAADWFEKHGWTDESINHSMAAKDWEIASRLITEHIHARLENGQMATIMRWIEGLPRDILYRKPKLCTMVAETYAHAGMMDQVDPFLNKAEELVSSWKNKADKDEIGILDDLSSKDITSIRSMVGILRGYRYVCLNDPNRALDFLQKAFNDIPEMGSRELALLHWIEGWAYRSLGRLGQSLDHLILATEFERKAGVVLRDIWTDLAITNRSTGNLHQAIDIFTNSLQMAADRGIQKQGNLSRDEAYLSLLFLEQNQLDLAVTHANRAIAYTQWWPSQTVISIAYACLAQILLARGDVDGCLTAVQKADLERKNRLMTPFVHSLVDVTLVQCWLTRGDWGRLDSWSSDQISILKTKLAMSDRIDEYLEKRLIVLVRVWMNKTKVDHQQRYEECLRLLAQLENSSRPDGRGNSLVEVLILKSGILYAQGKNSEAMDCLEECLALAEAGGYMRIFLNTGEVARDLLSAYLQKPNPTHKRFANKVLKEFGGLLQTQYSPNKLPEPLTAREIEVLQLLARGYSNQQMAEKLVLAVGTVKYHVHNLLGKLQVESRTQAIAKAKELDLI
jgi:ATP/maltotriose-dependent transcriptional regulator MalT/DNA-binding SARP family transcriptional activator